MPGDSFVIFHRHIRFRTTLGGIFMPVLSQSPATADNGLSPATVCTARRVANRISSRLRSAYLDRHDIEQELILDVLRRSARFDSGRSQSRTFQSRCVRHKAAEIVRYELRKKRRPESADMCQLHSGAPNNQNAYSQGDNELPHLEPLIESEVNDRQRAMDVESVISALPENLQLVCGQLMNTSQSGARRHLGLTKREMSAALFEIRNRFEAMGLGNDL
jgi:DNA-directed RNA polymerase specialized sigma24 family protein